MMNPRHLFFAALTGCLILTSPAIGLAAGSAGSHKVDRAVRQNIHNGSATQSVIITVKPGYRAAIREALRQHGDIIKSEHPLIEALAVELHNGDVDEIANQPWVQSVSSDAFVYAKTSSKESNESDKSDKSDKSNKSEQVNDQLQNDESDKHDQSDRSDKSDHSDKSHKSNQTKAIGGLLRATLGLPRVAPAGTDWPTGATGVAIAIIDSGITPSDEFGGRIVGFYDFTRGGVATAPFDDYGHGTHIAGLIGGSGTLSNYEYQGIAPDVRFIALKVLDGKGRGKTSDVIKAIEYVIANKARLNVQIINLSLGHPIYAPAKYDPLVQAVEKASAAGLIVVTASGNLGEKGKTGVSGYTGIISPGNAPSAITAGAAMTRDTIARGDDVVAKYSSRGPTWFDAYEKPDVVAPGQNLASPVSQSSYLYKTLKANHLTASNGLPLLQLSGSSMAAGVTSGVVALILQAHNQNGFHNGPLSANLVKAMLQYSAIPIAGADYLTQGAGEINGAGAIMLARGIDSDVAAGSWWLRSGVSTSTVFGGRSYAWGQKVIWGDKVLTGNVVYTSNIVWSTGIIWGTNVVWGTNFVLASNIVWGTNILWGTNIVWGERIIGQADGDNIVWGTADGDNIVWGTLNRENIVWGTWDGDNIVWGTWDGDNIVWGTSDGDNIVWGTSDGDNIVWGTADGDNIVWGTAKAATIVWQTILGPVTLGGIF